MTDASTQQEKATLTIGDRTAATPAAARRRTAFRASTSRRSAARPGTRRSTTASSTRRRPSRRSPSSTATRASCATAGYPIEQLAQNSTYLEAAWLLIYGELPTPDELGEFDEKIRHHTLLHEDLKRFFSSLPHTAHPMSVLSSATAALSTYYENRVRPEQPRARRAQHDPPAREAPGDRRLRAQEEHRPGVPLPRQHAQLSSTTS